MKAMILVGKTNLKTEEERILKKDFRLSGENNFMGRIPCFFWLQPGNKGLLPVLIFKNKENEGQFYEKLKEENYIDAFTTMPLDYLRRFDGKIFRNTDKTRSIRISIYADTPESQFSMIKNRMLRFTYTEEQPPNPGTKVIIENSPEKDEEKYTILLEPMIFEFDDRLRESMYSNFFKEKTDFPLALPLAYHPVQEKKDNFFSRFQHEVTSSRISIKEYFARNVKNLEDTLFFTLWELCDKAVFCEYLKEGAHFNIYSLPNTPKANEKNDMQTFEKDGKSRIQFCYSHDSAEFISEWRGNLLEMNENNPISEIKGAIISDLKEGLSSLLTAKVAKDDNKHITDWNKIVDFEDKEYDNPPEGDWQKIEKLAHRIPDPHTSDFIKNNILEPSKKVGNINPDHFKAKWAFTSYLFPNPLGHHDNEINRIWEDIVIDNFLSEDWDIEKTRREIDETIEQDDKDEYIYNKGLSPAQVLKLRLLLPVDASIRCLVSNELDHRNAQLDNHLILS